MLLLADPTWDFGSFGPLRCIVHVLTNVSPPRGVHPSIYYTLYYRRIRNMREACDLPPTPIPSSADRRPFQLVTEPEAEWHNSRLVHLPFFRFRTKTRLVSQDSDLSARYLLLTTR